MSLQNNSTKRSVTKDTPQSSPGLGRFRKHTCSCGDAGHFFELKRSLGEAKKNLQLTQGLPAAFPQKASHAQCKKACATLALAPHLSQLIRPAMYLRYSGMQGLSSNMLHTWTCMGGGPRCDEVTIRGMQMNATNTSNQITAAATVTITITTRPEQAKNTQATRILETKDKTKKYNQQSPNDPEAITKTRSNNQQSQTTLEATNTRQPIPTSTNQLDTSAAEPPADCCESRSPQDAGGRTSLSPESAMEATWPLFK